MLLLPLLLFSAAITFTFMCLNCYLEKKISKLFSRLLPFFPLVISGLQFFSRVCTLHEYELTVPDGDTGATTGKPLALKKPLPSPHLCCASLLMVLFSAVRLLSLYLYNTVYITLIYYARALPSG